MRQWILIFLSIKIDIPLMLGYFEHVYKLPMKFFASRKTGEITTRYSDASTIKSVLTSIAMSVVMDIVMAVGTGFVLFRVADTGCGISPEVLPHIFEQGFSTGGSSGLGLSICLDAVKTHSGEIWVERTGETGTVFAFTVLKEDFA